MVQEHDEPILECLEDIKVVLSKPEEPMVSVKKLVEHNTWCKKLPTLSWN